MSQSTYRFAILGMSLSNLLDISQPQDLLRGLSNTLSEYDQSKEDSDKPKIVRSPFPRKKINNQAFSIEGKLRQAAF
jgi:hypothetical protein